MLNRTFPVLVWITSLFLAGCADLATGLDAEEARLLSSAPTVPGLLKPLSTAIEQNDPSSGCPDAGNRGQGFVIRFDWTDSEASEEIAGYQLWVMHRGSQFPLVDWEVGESEMIYLGCGFVVDRNLKDWEWKVRARSLTDTYSAWSPVGTFEFQPCRLADGTKCRTTE